LSYNPKKEIIYVTIPLAYGFDRDEKLKLFELTRKKSIVIGIILVGLLIPSALAYDYTQRNPRFCTSCHLMNPAYESWDQSAMHDVNCHTCHKTDILRGLEHVVSVITKNPQRVTLSAEVDNEICENCHASKDPRWLQIVNTAGHRVHLFGRTQPPRCTDCHGIRLHNFTPPEAVCQGCHDQALMMGGPEMKPHCTVCHGFTATGDDLFPKRKDCLSCHEGRETTTVSFPLGAHANTSCSTCHNPHASKEHTACRDCHDPPEQGLHQIKEHSDCVTYHIPHSRDKIRDACANCHRNKE